MPIKIKIDPEVYDAMIKQAIDMINRNVFEEDFNIKVLGKLKIFIDTEPKCFICVINNIEDLNELKGRIIYLGSNS